MILLPRQFLRNCSNQKFLLSSDNALKCAIRSNWLTLVSLAWLYAAVLIQYFFSKADRMMNTCTTITYKQGGGTWGPSSRGKFHNSIILYSCSGYIKGKPRQRPVDVAGASAFWRRRHPFHATSLCGVCCLKEESKYGKIFSTKNRRSDLHFRLNFELIVASRGLDIKRSIFLHVNV